MLVRKEIRECGAGRKTCLGMNTENRVRGDQPGTGEWGTARLLGSGEPRESPSERWCLQRAGSVGAQKISVFPKEKYNITGKIELRLSPHSYRDAGDICCQCKQLVMPFVRFVHKNVKCAKISNSFQKTKWREKTTLQSSRNVLYS